MISSPEIAGIEHATEEASEGECNQERGKSFEQRQQQLERRNKERKESLDQRQQQLKRWNQEREKNLKQRQQQLERS